MRFRECEPSIPKETLGFAFYGTGKRAWRLVEWGTQAWRGLLVGLSLLDPNQAADEVRESDPGEHHFIPIDVGGEV